MKFSCFTRIGAREISRAAVILMAALLPLLVSCKRSSKPVEPAADATTIDVMTFNVRLGTANDGNNSWNYRRFAASMMINEQRPVAFGVQEAYDFQLEYLVQQCKCYKCVGVGREDGKSAGEHMSVFYDTTRVELKDWGTYWLSETPDVPSLGWDAACKRTATWTLLEDKKAGRSFFFVNTHLDHVGVEARKNGLTLVVERIGKMNPDVPMILCGDFNVFPDDPCLDGLRAVMQDSWQTAAEVDDGTTWHDWGRNPDDPHIDYIFYSRFAGCESIRRVTKEYGGRPFVSDHYPVVARLRY
ncbi:MAG: endonuclease/exonuclease/phosphatase family protein [Bacteroidales bacterium]|nr:endonuclease/exonuclease/phosphatase family protein [Bacteroidales bacterium]